MRGVAGEEVGEEVAAAPGHKAALDASQRATLSRAEQLKSEHADKDRNYKKGVFGGWKLCNDRPDGIERVRMNWGVFDMVEGKMRFERTGALRWAFCE